MRCTGREGARSSRGERPVASARASGGYDATSRTDLPRHRAAIVVNQDGSPDDRSRDDHGGRDDRPDHDATPNGGPDHPFPHDDLGLNVRGRRRPSRERQNQGDENRTLHRFFPSGFGECRNARAVYADTGRFAPPERELIRRHGGESPLQPGERDGRDPPDAQRLGRSAREIDHPAVRVRPAIIDPHHHAASAVRVLHPHPRAEGKGPMGRRHGQGVEPLSAGGEAPVKAWPVPLGRTALSRRSCPRARARVVARLGQRLGAGDGKRRADK